MIFNQCRLLLLRLLFSFDIVVFALCPPEEQVEAFKLVYRKFIEKLMHRWQLRLCSWTLLQHFVDHIILTNRNDVSPLASVFLGWRVNGNFSDSKRSILWCSTGELLRSTFIFNVYTWLTMLLKMRMYLLYVYTCWLWTLPTVVGLCDNLHCILYNQYLRMKKLVLICAKTQCIASTSRIFFTEESNQVNSSFWWDA